MRRWLPIVILLVLLVIGAAVPPFTTTFMRTVLDDATSSAARTTLAIGDHQFQPLWLAERSTDPTGLSEGESIIWLSDGTEKGDDGDVMVASMAAGVARYGTLFDHSGGTVWADAVLLETGDALLLESGDKLLLEYP